LSPLADAHDTIRDPGGGSDTAPSSARRPVVYDLTHLVSRLSTHASSGIDRVDLAYGAYFTAGDHRMVAGAHYGLRRPHALSVEQSRAIVDLARAPWRHEGDDARFSPLSRWLKTSPAEPFDRGAAPARRAAASARLTRSLAKIRFRLLDDRRLEIPKGAIYLNAAQHVFEHALFFRWLEKRDDLRRVFLIHDLLSLDYPEYFRASNLEVFRRRLATAFRYADAFVVSTQAVAARLSAELKRQGSPDRPIHVQPFASPLEGAAVPSAHEAASDGHPYFVMIGTIEPRKNHLLILHLWRRLAARDPGAPRLVIVGARGWENEQIVDLLDRAPALRAHVVELSGLPDADLSRLLCGARALLAPSFDEGYGLPLVEALSLGAPVAASDIAVFREATQSCAKLLSPLDGPAWRDEIVRLSENGEYYRQRREQARQFVAPTWEGYFQGVGGFLRTL
jgi:glycosyltransferase involved in cell wall biosynthesis